MAIAYDFPFNPWESEINASAYGDDIKAAHKKDIMINVTKPNFEMNCIYIYYIIVKDKINSNDNVE